MPPPPSKGKPPQVPLSKKAAEALAHNKAGKEAAAARRAANNQSRKAGREGKAARNASAAKEAVSRELMAAAAGAGAAAEAVADALSTTDPTEVASSQGSVAVEAASNVAEQFSLLASEASDENSEFLGASAGKSKKEKNKERRSAQAEDRRRLIALQQSQLQTLVQSRRAPVPIATQNYTESFTAKNLVSLNKKVEDSVDWNAEFEKTDMLGVSLRKKIADWAIQCGYQLKNINLSLNGYVVLEFTDDIHFTFHSSQEGKLGQRKEVHRSVKGAFHAQKDNEKKLIRYITKSSDPFYFQKSQVQIRQSLQEFNQAEKTFIDGVFSIINEAKIKGVEAKGGRRRTRKLRR